MVLQADILRLSQPAFGSFVNDTAENKATLLRIEKHLKQTNSCIDNINKHIDEEKKQKENEE